jgi:hypothetical protein
MTSSKRAVNSQLDQLKEYTIVVADTGDVDAIKRLQPQDATTNPSLIYKASSMEQYAKLIDDAIDYGKGDVETTLVSFYRSILKKIPGRPATAAKLVLFLFLLSPFVQHSSTRHNLNDSLLFRTLRTKSL